MPPRRAPPPLPLTILTSVAALVAAWLSLALDQLLRGAIGALAGVPWHGLRLSPEHGWTVIAVQGTTSYAAPGALAVMLLAGAVLVPVAALSLLAVSVMTRGAAWTRNFALAWFVVACLWGPTELASAALPGGGGGAADLYARLGEPQAGRWAAFVLGTVAMLLVAGPLSRWTVAVGRDWIRADSPDFRRRLVLALAGWPGACAAFVLMLGAGWARTPWALVWPVAILVTLQVRTR